METKKQVHNLIILDESGSMSSIKTLVIQGFNEIVQTMKGIEKKFPGQEHLISLVSFNSLGRKILHDCEPLSAISELDAKAYRPDSCTPLYDAIGFSIGHLQSQIAKVKEHHVLVTILTDGHENDSKEYTGAAIKKMIEDYTSQGWTFTYIGTDHAVEQAASNISIMNVMNFEKNQLGVHHMFVKESKARFEYSSKISRNENVQDGFYEDE